MANTNWQGSNPVYVDPPSPVARPIGWHETKRGKRPIPAPAPIRLPIRFSGPWPRLRPEPAGLDAWAADPKTERPYIRIDVSAERLGAAVSIAADCINERGFFANIDTGFSVYCGETEQRLSITLFEVSLCGAFGFFATLRARLREAGYEVDCGRFYFEVDGRETSHCAKRLAPEQFTLAAGLSLDLQTQTEGADYGKTEVYASGAVGSSDSEHA